MFSRKVRTFDGDDLVEEVLFDVTWNQIRTHRDGALKATDWRAVKDRTMTQAWKDYRQALRDLPQNYETANDAADNWPEAPE